MGSPAPAASAPDVRERPILFSGPMIRALLDGRKTVTRRLIRPQPSLGDGGCWFPYPPRQPAHCSRHYANEAHLRKGLAIDFPVYGQTGDRLWVRETWSAPGAFAQHGTGRVAYRADAEANPYGQPWKPSIHMPRWASRLTLEVVSVRAERLHDISEEDARAEGIELLNHRQSDGIPLFGVRGAARVNFESARSAFAGLWTDINGAESWDANPWVWAISFRKVEAADAVR